MAKTSGALLKKVTIKAVGITKNDMRENFGKPVCRVIGQAVSNKTITTDYGDSERFTGRFEFTNLLSGETKSAMVAFFPRILEDMVLAALANGAASFAVDITSVKNDASVTGYEYGIVPLTDTVDPLDAIKAQIKALPSPTVQKPRGITKVS